MNGKPLVWWVGGVMVAANLLVMCAWAAMPPPGSAQRVLKHLRKESAWPATTIALKVKQVSHTSLACPGEKISLKEVPAWERDGSCPCPNKGSLESPPKQILFF